MTPSEIASATPEQQRDVLEALFKARFAYGNDENASDVSRRVQFHDMLNCGAYESAVLMFLPKGWGWSVAKPIEGSQSIAMVWCYPKDRNRIEVQGLGATPALALAAAIVKVGEP